MTITCPNCGSSDFYAVEQFTSRTPCRLIREETEEVQIEFDMRAELARDAATSVVLAYTCASEGCNYVIPASEIQMGGIS